MKNLIKQKENRLYLVIALVIIIMIGITYIYNFVIIKQKGLVINKVVMKENNEEAIGVYIDGEVNSPGYILIPKNQTLSYAINKAQGITKEADIQNIDIDKKLNDQEKIIIPKKKSSDDNEEEIMEMTDEKVNINTASKEELMQIEGIGEKTAEKIIEYREKNKFTDIEELKEVKGIGDKKFEKIKDNIKV